MTHGYCRDPAGLDGDGACLVNDGVCAHAYGSYSHTSAHIHTYISSSCFSHVSHTCLKQVDNFAQLHHRPAPSGPSSQRYVSVGYLAPWSKGAGMYRRTDVQTVSRPLAVATKLSASTPLHQRRRNLCLCSHSYTGIDMSEARSGGAAPAADKAGDYRLPTNVYPKVGPPAY